MHAATLGMTEKGAGWEPRPPAMVAPGSHAGERKGPKLLILKTWLLCSKRSQVVSGLDRREGLDGTHSPGPP